MIYQTIDGENYAKIRDIATENQVSKTAVMKVVNAGDFRECYVIMNAKKELLISEKGCEQLKIHFEEGRKSTTENRKLQTENRKPKTGKFSTTEEKDAIIAMLRAEIEMKNKQIESMQTQIDRLIEQQKTSLDNVKELVESVQAAQLLHSKTLMMLDEPSEAGETNVDGITKKRRWWRFGNRK